MIAATTSRWRALRPAVVVNPAKVDDIEQLTQDVTRRSLRSGGAEPAIYETTVEDPGEGQSRKALEAGADLLIVCGGDGTVRACAGVLAGTDIAMAVVPCGSGNLLARNLDLPRARDAALDLAFSGGSRRRVDVLQAGDQSFLVMAGLGFDAMLIRETDEDLKARLGWLAYLGGAWHALRRSRSAWFRVSMDDGPPSEVRGICVLIGNVGTLRAGMVVFPAALPDNGVLDVVVLAPQSALHWVALAWNVLRGHADTDKRAKVLRGRRVHVAVDRALPVEFDGDGGGELRSLTVDVRPGALLVCTGDPISPPTAAGTR